MKGILVWCCMCDAKDVWCFSWYSNWISEVDESCLPNFARYLCIRDVVRPGEIRKHPVLQKCPLIPPSLNASNHFHSFDVVMQSTYVPLAKKNKHHPVAATRVTQLKAPWQTKRLGQICQFSSETVGLRSFGGMSNTHRGGLRFVGLQATKGVD